MKAERTGFERACELAGRIQRNVFKGEPASTYTFVLAMLLADWLESLPPEKRDCALEEWNGLVKKAMARMPLRTLNS
jgi:hypothetical protein